MLNCAWVWDDNIVRYTVCLHILLPLWPLRAFALGNNALSHFLHDVEGDVYKRQVLRSVVAKKLPPKNSMSATVVPLMVAKSRAHFSI